MDINKPVIIVCSGPSARRIAKLKTCYVCAVNLCSLVCDYTDFWVVNDANFLRYFDTEKLKSIQNLIIPEYPHSVLPNSCGPSKKFPYAKVTEKIPSHIQIHPFELKKSIKSSGESAVKWLIDKGFKNLISIGMDAGGGRHSLIPGMVANSKAEIITTAGSSQRYKQANEACIKRVLAAGVNLTKLIIKDKNTIVNDDLIRQINFNNIQEFSI